MFPVKQILPMILVAFGQALSNPLFWLVVLLVGAQYRRFAQTKQRLFGVTDEPVWQHTLLATFHGLLGGLLGSFLMILVGISLSQIPIVWLLILAFSLMLISPRFLCFSYAGGIISLSSILLGFPKTDVPHLMGLVAILHMVESILILISGHLGALPVYTRNVTGRVVGAFNLQKFWPIPIVALLAVPLTGQVNPADMVQMPDWWPLIRPMHAGNLDNVIYAILPVIAGLGYGDLAVTSVPQRKSRISAFNLAVYSLLLGLSVFASYYPVFSIVPALFGPLGHEYIIKLGQRRELNGKPLYVAPPEGVMVLDVLRSSPAASMGLKSGDILISVNGYRVNSRYDLAEALAISPFFVEVDFISFDQKQFVRRQGRKPVDEPFGVILAPEPYDSPHVEFGQKGFLPRFWERLLRK
ncbi:PDZ/DHR/GLGF domain-containing protein [Calderihabitans maritimus]|uniref:PDZ/DHR/GLGF domain-containing protein n=1 Tax=Calderihabitans maritimus TaxID=1246530 RepID=A0A1Z5HUG1_9FIRM|nr:PDZ/DHR/GLGF domain-containing protein [Calderihabitans maritimus]